MNFAYLGVLILSASFPLAFSASKRFGFGARWKLAWAAVLLAALPFVVWDMVFTRLNVWGFNSKYVLGFFLLNLPIEEVLFFIAIPFSCLFIYQSLQRYPAAFIAKKYAASIWSILFLATMLTALFPPYKAYTTTVTCLAALTSLSLAIIRPVFSGRLLIALVLQFFPFALVNGVLTALPVVTYDNSQILGLRFGSIPIEDSVYSLVLLVVPVTLYEFLLRKNPQVGSSDLPLILRTPR